MKADTGPGDPPIKTPLRVLFFEDNIEDVELSRRALLAAGFAVDSDIAVNAREFREHVAARTYDVVLSDFHMPGANGLDALAWLKQAGVNIPFILVTGSLGDEKAVECVKEGVSDYVIKDRLARLPIAIRKALEEQRIRAQQVEAEEALRASEERYRSLIQNAPCGIFRLSAIDGCLAEANTEMARILGYTGSEELLAAVPNDGIRVDAALLRSWTEECLANGRTIQSTIEWKRRDGAPVVVGLRGRLLLDANARPTCFEMVAENISERHEAQARIDQLNRLYSVLSEAGQAVIRVRTRVALYQEICRIIVIRGRFRMAWVGLVEEGGTRLLPVADCHAEGYLDKIRITTADEPAGQGPTGTCIRERRHVICQDLNTASTFRPWRTPASRRGYRSSAAFPLSVRGEVIGAITIYSERTQCFDGENVALLNELAANISFAQERIEIEEEHQRAVEELDQFFSVSLDKLCILGKNGTIQRLNTAWKSSLGFPGEGATWDSWLKMVHPDDRTEAVRAFTLLQKGADVNQLELRFSAQGGGYRWLLGSISPSANQDMFFAAMNDITERKALEEQLVDQNLKLEEQNRRVEAANRMKSEFLANMSHELRSPLNGILGFSELLYDGKLGTIPDRPREFLRRIHASARHLLQLINAVLDLSKVEAGRLEFHPEPTHAGGLIREVIEVLGAVAAQKQIMVETVLDPAVDELFIDPGCFKQILYNYLSNALKFSGAGGRVVVRSRPEGPDHFALEVSDSGIGIAEKDVGRLFVEFQQLDDSRAKRFQGTGLGLALTKRIVEAQGGRVGVRSEPGAGSTFFAVLPCRYRGAPIRSIAESETVAR